MLYKEDWERAQQKYLEFWARENHDRSVISVTAPRAGYIPKEVKKPTDLMQQRLDIEYKIKDSREYFAGTYFGGEAFPNTFPNLGPDIFGAFLGCNIVFGEDTTWAEHFISDWSAVKKFKFDPQNKWWKIIKEMTEALVEDSKGDYLIGMNDLHSGADGLVSLRGPENLCTDLYDEPEAVKRANFELLEVFKIVIDELYQITTKYQSGCTNWLCIWHPKKWYVTSCDFSCMISKEMFAEFILPELQAELDHLEASIYHLDGPRALKHLDALLEIPNLNGIQWVYGAGQPSASHWIPILQKIQNAGKLINIGILPDELEIMLKELKPEGLSLDFNCRSEQEAKDLLKMAEKAYQKKVF